MRSPWLVLISLTLLATASGTASAQFGYTRPLTSPNQTPVLSPYANLARGGSAALNYFGLTRPEQHLYNSVNSLQQQVTTNAALLNSNMQPDLSLAPVTTGHPIYFLNYQQYFLNTGTAGQASLLRQPGMPFGSTAGSALSPNSRMGLASQPGIGTSALGAGANQMLRPPRTPGIR
jgi:hypothetical protein